MSHTPRMRPCYESGHSNSSGPAGGRIREINSEGRMGAHTGTNVQGVNNRHCACGDSGAGGEDSISTPLASDHRVSVTLAGVTAGSGGGKANVIHTGIRTGKGIFG